MSRLRHNSSQTENNATLWSYILGFILSLILTAVPYHMVVNTSLAGTRLLIIILIFAFLQMLVQIFFFLHLGRGPQPLYNVFFFMFTILTILIVVGGSVFIMNNLHYNMTPDEMSKNLAEDEGIYQVGGKETGACRGVHINHKVTISNGNVSPAHVIADYCDTLTFINEDDKVRELTFGTHPEHGTYAGESELDVRKGRGKTIILNQPGTYQFHDHPETEIYGFFTVNN